jgi:hypothetical protein
VARYLDEAAQEPLSGPPPDFLSHSHGEGFLRFFEERCRRQGLFIFDEPESALSPSRQIEFLKLLRRMERSGIIQVIMATHSPMLMAYPDARLLRLTKGGLDPISVEDTDHFRLMREFGAGRGSLWRRCWRREDPLRLTHTVRRLQGKGGVGTCIGTCKGGDNGEARRTLHSDRRGDLQRKRLGPSWGYSRASSRR